MLKKNKKILTKYFIIKTFIAGMILKSNDILIIKKNILNINDYIIKLSDNNINLINKKKKIILLLNKREQNIILYYNYNKNYKCIPIELFKLNFLFKLKISIVKKGMTGFDIINTKF
ncbi:hypothetical protein CRP_060 [Candidatus Carsonella ruddii PV]|uniref:Uncharacterized protein n=1 Tax=Carsonella ruddii (strain PV) TaxID=387662 RepID=Q05FT0_CARRP|nr:SsrA-binding protein [Candidatus Carsonella ruddii]BAF35091.1 hypothetical protein CRP_060 [Candidatus Carsonella ruddii PV]